MKKIFLVLAALFVATPALAAPNSNFTGPRADLSIGIGESDDVNYGARVGLDAPLGDIFTIGGSVTSDNVFDRDRSIGADARLGAALHPNFLVYGTVGYENIRRSGADGLRYGAGAQIAVARNLYTGIEYRRNDEARSDSVMASLGIRL